MSHRRTMPTLTPAQQSLALDRILSKSLQVPSGCWEWQGSLSRIGYGYTSFMHQVWMAHRLAYAAQYGSFDRFLDVCHSCDNRRCCNPAHLWLGTMKDNIQDSRRKNRHFLGARTHCSKGHPYSPENTVVWVDKKGHKHRHCLACEKIRSKTWTPKRAERQRRKRAAQIGVKNPQTTWYSKKQLPERFGQPCRIVSRVAIRRYLVEFPDGVRIEAKALATRRPKGVLPHNGSAANE